MENKNTLMKGTNESPEGSVRWFNEGLREILEDERPTLRRKQVVAPTDGEKEEPEVIEKDKPFRVKKPEVRKKQVVESKDKFITPGMILPGSMYMFYYQPKGKDDLPYYDRFPLILCVDVGPTHFTGLNLHYIRPSLRLRLLEALKTRMSNRNYDEKTRLLISYRTLRAASRMRYYKPCFKQYIKNHVLSRVKKVHPTEWDKTLMLPNESFVGLGKKTVWSISESMI